MASSNPKQINPWDWDVRVRERNLKNGTLDDSDVDKHLGQLQDAGWTWRSPLASRESAVGGRTE